MEQGSDWLTGFLLKDEGDSLRKKNATLAPEFLRQHSVGTLVFQTRKKERAEVVASAATASGSLRSEHFEHVDSAHCLMAAEPMNFTWNCCGFFSRSFNRDSKCEKSTQFIHII